MSATEKGFKIYPVPDLNLLWLVYIPVPEEKVCYKSAESMSNTY